MHPIFKLREEPTPQIIELLESVTLGTDGAHYRHLDSRERIYESDQPLFLTMERHQRALGNITFCRREKHWYIRYFAFDTSLQAKGNQKSKSKDNLLKRELSQFFNEKLDSGEVDSFYAYIDPRNVKSLWMSENFGFETVGEIATQTYSRSNPKPSARVVKSKPSDQLPPEITERFHNDNYFYTAQLDKPPYYSIVSDQGELLAFAKTNVAQWEIKRLPGKMGGFLVKVIPYVPVLKRIIKPKNHAFVVPEAVVVKDNDPALLTELFDGILAHEKQNLILWWTDYSSKLYREVQPKVNWGLLHKLVGVNRVNVVVKSKKIESILSKDTPFFTSGFDFI